MGLASGLVPGPARGRALDDNLPSGMGREAVRVVFSTPAPRVARVETSEA